VGVIMFGRRYRQALTTLLLVTIAGFAFSFLGGFSIGRFTALLPCWSRRSLSRTVEPRGDRWRLTSQRSLYICCSPG